MKEADHTAGSFAGPLAPAGVRYLPGEDVLLLAVDMPAMSASQRRTAVAFAVEDQISAPLDDVHVVLGPKLAESGRWLVAVVARDVLARTTAGRKTRLIPDTLALPVPESGHWSVWVGGNRVLVRTPDGAGFATDPAALPIFHLVAGHPGIVLYDGTLDAQYGDIRPALLPARLEGALDRLDLTGARDTGRAFVVPRAWGRIAAVLAAAAVAHIGLLVVDTWALGQVRTTRQMDVRGILDALGQPAGGDIDAAITQTLARTNGTTGPRVIPMMSQTFATLAAQAGQVTLSDLRYTADQGSLTLTLQAPDIVTLQSVEVALTDAGFRVTVGAATTAGGLAEQQLILQGAGS